MTGPWVTILLLYLVYVITGLLGDRQENKAIFLTANVGEYAVFHCPIDFPHDTVVPYSLRWSKEKKAVFQWYEGVFTTTDSVYEGRINLLPSETPNIRGSVNLTNIRESDSGWYECTVFFPNRKPNTRPNGTWFHLNVEGGTLLQIPPINVTTLERGPAHFPCVTKDNATVTWHKDGIPLAELPGLSARSTVDWQGSLTISATDMTDTGEYLCVVTNNAGDRQTAGAFLDVQYKAKVVYSPKEVYLPYGRPGMLDCHFRANPGLTNLRWEKDGFLFDAHNVPGVFYKRNGSLVFTQVDENHSGEYTCTPINELGTAGPSPIVNVIVQRPPVFTITPHNLYLRKQGDTLEMACDATDSDVATHASVVWLRKDGLPLPINRTRLINSNLTIDRLEANDAGFYQCVASNEAASITTDTELMIEPLVPRARYNLTSSSTSTSIRLRWLPGFLQPTDYSVLYRPMQSPEWRQTRVTSRTAADITLEHLTPGREYEVMLLSQDRHGGGRFSKTLRVWTEPSGSSSRSDTTHDDDTRGGEDTRRGTSGGEDTRRGTSVGEDTRRGMSDGDVVGEDNGIGEVARNEATVRRVTTRGETTRKDTPLGSSQNIGPPRNVVANFTPEGYLVHWDPPESSGDELKLYRVQWSLAREDQQVGSVVTADTWFLVTSLAAGSTYHLRVSASGVHSELEASSTPLEIRVPSETTHRVLAVGAAIGTAVLLVALAVGVYMRRQHNRLPSKTEA